MQTHWWCCGDEHAWRLQRSNLTCSQSHASSASVPVCSAACKSNFLQNSMNSASSCLNKCHRGNIFLQLSRQVNKNNAESVDVNLIFFSPSSIKVLMFNRILYKYASEAGYPEYISRRLLTSLPLVPFALRFLWSASHNVKEGDACPFAISLIWSRYFLYRANAVRSVRNLLSWYLPLSLFPSFLRPLAVPRSPSTPPLHCFPSALSHSVLKSAYV